MLRRCTILLISFFLLVPHFAQAQNETLPEHPEIMWDVWGVPHIYAPTDEGLFYAFGWAQAHNHGDLLLRLYGQARGKAAEYWGDEFLESDQQVWTLSIPQQAAQDYAALPDDFRVYTDAFVAGINDYATAHPEALGEEWKAVLPITGSDIIGHAIRVLRYSFVARRALSAAQEWADGELGSNGWAIGPSRSANGHAMLVANPHQPWSDLGLWIEAQLVSPDINVYGAALVGNPVLGIAFNQYLGWTHTVNTHDGWDLYQLTPGTNGGYMFDGEEKPFDVHDITIKVKQADGTLRDVPLTVKASVHGPIIAERDGVPLALRVVGDRTFEAAQEWWEMGKARNLAEFEAALRNIRIPMFTIMYADRDGNIMHVFNEQVPVRSEGDWAFWNNTTPVDDSHPALIPGDRSRYLWTTYLCSDDLPKVLNPASGWLQNANEPPWTTTLPLALNPADYPAYMLPPPFLWPRPQTSMRLLYEEQNPISFERLIELKQSTFVEMTRWMLDDLIAAASQSDDELVKRAGDVLAKWDRHADADSVGTVLFAAWAAAYIRPKGLDALAVPFDIQDPLNTPHGLADPAGAVAALKQVAQQLELLRPLGGGIDVKYGDVFRIRYAGYDYPASGTDDVLGTFRTLTFTQDNDLRFRPVAGESYIAVVEFSDPPHAKVLLAYGNATQPDSPHFGDQIPLFAEKRLRDAWLTRAEVEAHLEGHEMLNGR
ncbi:MAG: acylase [Anaerolineae bacterium]